MTKTGTSNINYRLLTVSKIRDNFASFSIGAFIILLLLTLVSYQYFPKVKPLLTGINQKQSEEIKGRKATLGKKERIYIVKPGDQLYLIAQQIYGSGFNMEDIMKANNLTNPDSIEVGQKLIIPDVPAKFPTTGNILPSAANTEKVINEGDRYVVKDGDTLAIIALQFYGDTYSWIKIAEANNIVNPNNLAKGTILTIPK